MTQPDVAPQRVVLSTETWIDELSAEDLETLERITQRQEAAELMAAS